MFVSFEMNLDVLMVSRVGYTLFDLFSDIGGIDAILVSGISIVLSIWNYKNLDSHMASQLYKLSGDGPESYFHPPKLDNLKLYCIDILPCKCLQNR